MISIIICSRTPEISPALFQNIDATIGYKYELIVIDNSKNIYSIFEAYNIGIKKSKGDYWCFMHDDILLHTPKWGKVIETIFEGDIRIGLIGVAGAKIKTKMPSPWWKVPDGYHVMYIKQHFSKNNVNLWNVGWRQEGIQEVVVIDGVFMVGRKDPSILFDENLKGFHNYDLNISLSYHKENFKVVVTNKVLIEHFSIGLINKSWYVSALHFDSIYSSCLPLKINCSISDFELRKQEIDNGTAFCINLVKNGLVIQSLKFWPNVILQKTLSKFKILNYFKL